MYFVATLAMTRKTDVFSYCLKEYKLVDQDFKPFWVPCSWLPQVDAAQGLSLEQQLSYYDVAKERLRGVPSPASWTKDLQQIFGIRGP